MQTNKINRGFVAAFLGTIVGAGMLLAGAPAEAAPPSHAKAWGYRRKTQYSSVRRPWNSKYYRPVYRRDSDRDGIINRRDRDRDGDGIRNSRDNRPRINRWSSSRVWQKSGRYGDQDRDGIRNYRDRDRDGDGIRNTRDRRPRIRR